MNRDDESAVGPHRDAAVARMTIGTPDVLNRQIEIVAYDPAWPEQYVALERTIRGALGDQARLVEHAGSTSVPGLPAKPRIDIVLAVPDSPDEPAYVPHLEAQGFWLRIREPEWFEHRVFKFANPDVNLHTFTEGCSEIDKMLLFRDWLRSHPEDRDLYAAEKIRLGALTWTFTQHYADAKTGVVESILARAGWTSPPTRQT